MTELFSELAVAGDDIGDDDQVIYLLASLPDSFNVFVTALEANKDAPKMEDVTERLLHEEQKMKERRTGAGCKTDHEAMMSKHKKRGPQCHFLSQIRTLEKKLSGV